MDNVLVQRGSRLFRKRHGDSGRRRPVEDSCRSGRVPDSRICQISMTNLTRRIDVARAQDRHAREVLRREWLITNGLGGYASGTISGMVSRRYHGLLIAALPAPYGRVVMLNHLSEHLYLEHDRSVQIGGDEPSETGEATDVAHFVR